MVREADIDPDARPTQLSVEEFGRLSHVYKQLCDEIPGLYEYDYRSEENAFLWRTELHKLDI